MEKQINNLTSLNMLISRNVKLYFKDKISFFMSLITPLILLVLFITFLKNVYTASFSAFFPEAFTPDKSLINALTGGWLMSSIIGVSCVTIAFCSNLVMVQDKINKSINDLLVTPVKKSLLSISYYIANVISTLIVCFTAMAIGMIYLAFVGWYLSAVDVLCIIGVTFLYTFFGAALAALVEHFISTQGGLSAVATMVSSMYGFICGAYMPISQFSEPIRNFVSFIPGTYGVVLLRNFYMNGVLSKFEGKIPEEAISAIRNSFDVNIYFFEHKVQMWQMLTILSVSSLVFLGIYILININKKAEK